MAFDPARFGKWSHKAIQWDSATHDRASKIFALYSRAGTNGEKQAAKARLDSIAARVGVSFDTLTQVIANGQK